MNDWTEWSVTVTYDAPVPGEKTLAALVDALPNGSTQASGDQLVLRATVTAGSAVAAVLPASRAFYQATYKAGLRRPRMIALEILDSAEAERRRSSGSRSRTDRRS